MAVTITKQVSANLAHNQSAYLRFTSSIPSTKKFYIFINGTLKYTVDAYFGAGNIVEGAFDVSVLYKYLFSDFKKIDQTNIFNLFTRDNDYVPSFLSNVLISDVNSPTGGAAPVPTFVRYGNIFKFPVNALFLTDALKLKWVKGFPAFINFHRTFFGNPSGENLIVNLTLKNGGTVVLNTGQAFGGHINYSGASELTILRSNGATLASIMCEELEYCNDEKVYVIHYHNKYGGLETAFFAGRSEENISYDKNHIALNNSYRQATAYEDYYLNFSKENKKITLRTIEDMSREEYEGKVDFFLSPYYIYQDQDDGLRLKYLKMLTASQNLTYNGFGEQLYFLKADFEVPSLNKTMQV